MNEEYKPYGSDTTSSDSYSSYDTTTTTNDYDNIGVSSASLPNPANNEYNPNYDQSNYNNTYNNNSYNNGSYNPDDSKATIILILGILSIVCCTPCGIVAIIMRNMYKDKISPSNQGMVTAGFICGIVGTSILVLGILSYAFIFMFAIFSNM